MQFHICIRLNPSYHGIPEDSEYVFCHCLRFAGERKGLEEKLVRTVALECLAGEMRERNRKTLTMCFMSAPRCNTLRWFRREERGELGDGFDG